MTKSISFSLCSGLLMLLASCSNEFQPAEEAGRGRAVGFHAVTGKQHATRATDITSDNIDNFKVYAYKRESTAFIQHLEGVDVQKSGSAWTYAPVADWPDEAVVFNAYAPSKAFSFVTTDVPPRTVNVPQATLASAPKDAAGGGTGADLYTLGYTVPTAMASQVDLLVASATQTWSPTSNTVTLKFRHALSRILFQARLLAGNGDEVTITDISLLNLKTTGTLDMTRAADGFDLQWAIDPANADEVDALPVIPLNAGVPGEITVKCDGTGKYLPILVGDSGVMVLPQPTTLGANRYGATLDVTAEKAGHDFYIMVTWRLSNNTYKTALCNVGSPSAPLNQGIEFLPGKQYTFNLSVDAATNQIEVGSVGVADMDDVAPIVVQPQYDAHTAAVVGTVAWAKTDVAKPGVFAADNTAGMFYQHNRIVGWAAPSPFTGYDATGAQVGYACPSAGEANGTWAVTPPSTDAIGPCPTGWRLPTKAEWQALSDAAPSRTTPANMIVLNMPDGSTVELSRKGYINPTTAMNTTQSYYHTAEGTGTNNLVMTAANGSWGWSNAATNCGFSVRCVRTVPQ